MALTITGPFFHDTERRTVILRGVNLAGISIPHSPDGATHIKKSWPPRDLEHVSWVNRPFPLEECDTHFKRLRAWGFNCIRMLASWEAIEHAGPYQYDEAFLDYFAELIKRAGDYGFHVFVNFHQDVWSRVTGGDGAPLWLFDKVGLDYTKFDEADAAITMQHLWDPVPQHNRYQPQSWGENEKLFPVRTMWTLFWGGRDFAPRLLLEDEATGTQMNVQDYFFNHFAGVVKHVAQRVRGLSHVFGFNPLNEPSSGYIGCSVNTRPLRVKGIETREIGMPGIAWSPLDTMAAAAGYSRDIEDLDISILKLGLRPRRVVTVNPRKIRIWKEGHEDFWAYHGVWGITKGIPVTLNDNYFKVVGGRAVDFTRDYAVPFYEKITALLRTFNKNWVFLLENDPVLNGPIRAHPWPAQMPPNTADGFHWYDMSQLGRKHFYWPANIDIVRMRPAWGVKGIQKMYARQLGIHLDTAKGVNGDNCPCLVGEFGIAMDMDSGKAFRQWPERGNKAFKWHTIALDLMYNALDSLLLSGTHWNYVSFNRNGLGDFWNAEDLSIYSQDQLSTGSADNIYAGARGLEGFCRPFASHIAGVPLQMRFNRKTGEFFIKYQVDLSIQAPTEIFVPKCQYPRGVVVQCTGATALEDLPNQKILVQNPLERNVQVLVNRKHTSE